MCIFKTILKYIVDIAVSAKVLLPHAIAPVIVLFGDATS